MATILIEVFENGLLVRRTCPLKPTEVEIRHAITRLNNMTSIQLTTAAEKRSADSNVSTNPMIGSKSSELIALQWAYSRDLLPENIANSITLIISTTVVEAACGCER